MSSSENVKNVLEWVGLVMEVAQAVGTLMIGLAGLAWSSQDKKAAEYRNRRQLIAEATSQIDMVFALSVFKDRVFENNVINGMIANMTKYFRKGLNFHVRCGKGSAAVN